MQNTSYIAVFFDTALPALPPNSQMKTINHNQFRDLVDEAIPGKTIELVSNQVVTQYSITSRRIFHLQNSVDNTLFLICDVQKV